MTRLLAAATLLIATAAPALACEWNKSASADARSSTVASQSDTGQSSAPAGQPATARRS